MSTPIFDELEAKWTGENYQRAICDLYWTVTQTATGQEWFEDDEGNEVFPEGGLLPNRPATGVWVDLSEGHGSEAHVGTCGLVGCGTKRPKHKFKLFGRNQGTNGTL